MDTRALWPRKRVSVGDDDQQHTDQVSVRFVANVFTLAHYDGRGVTPETYGTWHGLGTSAD